MINSFGNSKFFQFILPLTLVAISCTSKIVFAEIPDCRQSLAAHPYLASIGAESNLRDQNLAKGVAVFLNLLDALLEEVGKSETDSLENQLRLLNYIAQSATPIKNLKMLSTEQSHLLNFLRNGDTLEKLASTISPEQWKQIQHFANEKRNELLRITEQHEAKAVEAEPDFADIPDIDGRVRLHHLLKTRQYEKAIALLKNPTTTTRYINTRDNNGNTPLDFFAEWPAILLTIDSRPAIEEGLKNPNLLSDDLAIRVAEMLIAKLAMTGMQLRQFESKFLEYPLPRPSPEEIRFSNLITYVRVNQVLGRVQDNLTRFYELGGNLEAANHLGENLASIYVKAGRLDRLKELKSLGGKLEYTDGTFADENLIHLAVAFGSWAHIPFLVENGVDINATDNVGRSPLFFLGNSNATETVKMLADYGADLSLGGFGGKTPAHYFSELNQAVQLQALAASGANLEAQDTFGETPLMLASAGNPLILSIFAEYFIAKGIAPESRGLHKKKNSNPPRYLKGEVKADD